jgi:hypothetical protein
MHKTSTKAYILSSLPSASTLKNIDNWYYRSAFVPAYENREIDMLINFSF